MNTFINKMSDTAVKMHVALFVQQLALTLGRRVFHKHENELPLYEIDKTWTIDVTQGVKSFICSYESVVWIDFGGGRNPNQSAEKSRNYS